MVLNFSSTLPLCVQQEPAGHWEEVGTFRPEGSQNPILEMKVCIFFCFSGPHLTMLQGYSLAQCWETGVSFWWHLETVQQEDLNPLLKHAELILQPVVCLVCIFFIKRREPSCTLWIQLLFLFPLSFYLQCCYFPLYFPCDLYHILNLNCQEI